MVHRFSSKLTFEKHLRSVSREASQRLSILRKSWRVFHDRLLIGRCFWGFVLPVLQYCSAVWCSAADTYLKLLDLVVSGACFLAGGVRNCNLSHRRFVAVLCMLYKIRCNSMHQLCGALPVPYVAVRVALSKLLKREGRVGETGSPANSTGGSAHSNRIAICRSSNA